MLKFHLKKYIIFLYREKLSIQVYSAIGKKEDIELPFLNEVGKAIGKASQGLNDAAQSIKTAAQDTRGDIARQRQEKLVQKEYEKQEEQERAAEQAHKCPKCGHLLSGISAVCPLCGYEIRNAKAADAISELTKEINKLNQKRNTVTDAIASKLSGRHNNPTDEKIASLIHNFVVPNTKEDIFEFMILAAGNMDAKFLAGKQKTSEVADVVIKAWASKFEQTFQKARFSFGQDKDFPKIEKLYNEKMEEIEEARHNSFFGRRKK